jgi:hypothetical protein
MAQTGYLSPKYTSSLEEFGRPVWLPQSGGALLVRSIPGTTESDAIGPYPLLCCLDWTALPADLASLDGAVVSVVLVTDPFGPDDVTVLERSFSHGLVRYKDHYFIDLAVPLAQSACAHHRPNARKALKRLEVEEIVEPNHYLGTWCGLYEELKARHRLTGVSCFSRRAFELQFGVPGLTAFRAVDHEGAALGMVLWYCQGDVGYYHLGAYSQRGYEAQASFALFWTAAQRLGERVRWLSLGAGAGLSCDGSDGLTRFKRGWTPLVRPTYLVRHVANPQRYAELCRGIKESDFFPPYRSPAATAA